MKLGDLEGTPKEIEDFFENNGLNLNDYFQPPDKPIHSAWLYVPAIIVVASVLWPNFTEATPSQAAPFLIGCLGIVWLSISLQIRYKQPVVSGIAGFGCVAVLVVSYRFLTPLEAIQQLQNFHQ
ncbi:hypothetical protein KBY93_12045 [Synechococcus sp. J7-Johnson]|uniref:hypothetical protein n=1 Tax=Synechococcus sp. J7-Johnson TaxID=2823737 RepID=UPI0020CF0545|nr:hypothetical protein [Synechococcus sp. J7-Johnson]MCP9841359.1 hypothetical protein [Synechococcus sp. J7-Johnson]